MGNGISIFHRIQDAFDVYADDVRLGQRGSVHGSFPLTNGVVADHHIVVNGHHRACDELPLRSSGVHHGALPFILPGNLRMPRNRSSSENTFNRPKTDIYPRNRDTDDRSCHLPLIEFEGNHHGRGIIKTNG